MISVNLIPKRRVESRMRARRIRGWALIGAGYAAALIAALAVYAGYVVGDLQDPGADLARTQAEVQQINRQINGLSQQVTQARTALEAGDTVAYQPDWSVLLALLAESLGQEVVLDRCRLEPMDESPAPAAAPNAGPRTEAQSKQGVAARFSLTLAGFGRTQAAVTDFVLRLEALRLFEQVKVRRTSREPYRDEQAIAFELECSLSGEEEARR